MMDAQIILWMIIFVGGYVGILGYFVMVAMKSKNS